MKLISQKKLNNKSELPFGVRATAALGISIVADVLDYIGAPIFALPVVGDISDTIVIAALYRLTGSKTSAAINAIEFIPFVGDMIPTYTISTLLWIFKESRGIRRKSGADAASMDLFSKNIHRKNQVDSITAMITNKNNSYYHIDQRNIIEADISNTSQESLRTKAMRVYAIFRSRLH
jgi:hypothetical protein